MPQTYSQYIDTLKAVKITFASGETLELQISESDASLLRRFMQDDQDKRSPMMVVDWLYKYATTGSRVFSRVVMIDLRAVEFVEMAYNNSYGADEIKEGT